LPKMVSKRLDLSFCIFARRGEKYSCYGYCTFSGSPKGTWAAIAPPVLGLKVLPGLRLANRPGRF